MRVLPKNKSKPSYHIDNWRNKFLKFSIVLLVALFGTGGVACAAFHLHIGQSRSKPLMQVGEGFGKAASAQERGTGIG